MIVLDASALVRYVVRVGDEARWVRLRIGPERELHVPELVDAETLQGLRGLVLRREISQAAAATAVRELLDAQLVRYPHRPLIERVWELRGQLTAYDALYVALAEALDATLVTTDRKLARAVTTVDVAVPA